MVYSLSGLPAIVAEVVFVLVFSAPVWLAAKIVGAQHATLLRAAASLVVGALGCLVLIFVIGPLVFLLAPIVFLVAFMVVLGTSFGGSILLAILAAVGYWGLAHLLGHWHGVVPPGSGAGPTISV